MRAPEYWEAAKAHLSAADPVFSKIITAYPDEHLTSKKQLFRTLANAIVGQQISVAAAESIWERLRAAAGGWVTPSRILALDVESMRACGLSGRKVEYLHGVAETFLGSYKNLRWGEMDDAAIRERLLALRGIGPWTTDMVLLFTFNRPDILPLLDIGLIRSAEKYWNGGKALSAEEIETLAEPWRPYRSVATWYLWRDLDAEPVAY